MNRLEEHGKLKEICDIIGYDLKYFWYDSKWFYKEYWYSQKMWVNVREIIFTTEFMEKFYQYSLDNFLIIDWESNAKYWDWKIDLLDNLDNPVDYLYNLIKENEKTYTRI